MCGIAGAVNFNFDTGLVNRVMGHRGPDAQASFQADNLLLNHLRLSILDLEGGAQPMHYLDRYTIIFNGEIYNHQEVRKELSINCRTNSDTETLLHAFHLEGCQMLHRLDGMFAFAIYDREKRRLFLARDRAGKKPCYYYKEGERFVFASELNALRKMLPLELATQNLFGYLRLGSMYRGQTPYQNVWELLPGHYLELDTTSMELKAESWWNIGDYYCRKPLELGEEAAMQELQMRLERSVRRRIKSSDLEVGAFLSGGIDSGLITAIASGLHSGIKTFTISFEGEFDEAPLAKLVADKYHTRHTEIKIGFEDLAHNVERIVGQYGEPFYDSSCIPSWYVSKAAAQHLTVILNGDGADELFGGYRRYVPFRQWDWFATPGFIRTVAGGLLKALPPSHNKRSSYNFLYRLVALAGKPGISSYLAASSDIFEGYTQYLQASEDLYFKQAIDDIDRIINSPISGLRKMLWMDFDVTLACDFLVKMDIATMAHSLEGRSPMLGKELLEWVPVLPDHFKIRGTQTKYLLKKLAARYLPPELLNQPKRGFEVPLKKWVKGELKELVYDNLTNVNALYPQLVQKEFVMQLLTDKVRISDEKRAKLLWTLTAMEIWYNQQRKL
jgi:asparagine synthase (glutamine-hydrolysing)